jgi:secreted trypsin-like serine protease
MEKKLPCKPFLKSIQKGPYCFLLMLLICVFAVNVGAVESSFPAVEDKQATDLEILKKSEDEISGDYENNMSRIIGGQDANSGEFPFMVALIDRYGRPMCGGSIVSPYYVMTAAHCVPGLKAVIIGAHNLKNNSSGQRISIAKKIVHPKYNDYSDSYDIALLKLSQPVSSEYPPIKLAKISDSSPGTMSTVIGWGATSNIGKLLGIYPDVLQKVDVPIVSSQDCRAAFGNDITDSMVCAGAGYGSGGKDSCNGDSGGPLFLNKNNDFYQVGVVSWGSRFCAQIGKYGVYTQVASFKSWINKYIGDTNGRDNDNGDGDNDWVILSDQAE